MNEEIKQATEQVLTEMLTESTGKHFMDSGDYYGRYWEENQANGIPTEIDCDYYIDKDTKETELIPSVPIFNAFAKTLRYTDNCKEIENQLPYLDFDVLHWIEEEIQQGKMYDKLNDLIGYQNICIFKGSICIYTLAEERIQLLGSTLNYAYNLLNQYHQTEFEENTYLGSQVSNSYNGEDLLNQGYMSIYFQYEGEDYIAISIHNGCDIRGGYTDVHIFEFTWGEDEFLLSHEKANIYCECNKNNYFYQQYDDEEEIDKKYVYENTYIENYQIKCKHCGTVLKSTVADI